MATRQLGPIDVERIFLYEENPRHEPIESEPEIIEYLCNDEQVYNLARSIADVGTNPLDLLGLVELPNSSNASTKKTYQVWEGNRRVCAIKLLNDPDRAPPHLRKDFARLAASSTHIPIKKLTCVVFSDYEELKFWMGIIHDGAQGGVGRSNWNADQKARHFGSNRNRVALAVLDAAERMNLISKEERDGKLTTAQRFLNSGIVREAVGIDATNPDNVAYNRPLADFEKQLGRFISDLRDGVRVNSRNNRAKIDEYGRALARRGGVSGERISPQSLATAATNSKSRTKQRRVPKQPRKIVNLEYDTALAAALQGLKSNKLESLYYSVCSIRIEQHTPLITIGVWAFVESLSALAGKHADTDFVGYYSNQRLSDFGFNGKKAVPIREALTRIQRNGNATKHHEIAASFDGKQLSNDLATITPLLKKTLEGVGPQK